MPTTVLHVENDKTAIFTKPTSGDPMGPFTDPEDFLSLVKFHSDFDYYTLHSGPSNVTINHPSVTGQTQSTSFPGFTVTKSGRIAYATHDLVTHNLGYIPDFLVIYNGYVVAPTTLIQITSLTGRFVTPFATTTKIQLHESGISGANGENLAAASRTYSVIVFKAPVASNEKVMTWDNVTGKLVLGKGKFSNDTKNLRRAASGDSPYDLSLGPAHDINNGGTRYVAPNGTVFSEPTYAGAFTGPVSLQCAVR